jgi:hypothetical protein
MPAALNPIECGLEFFCDYCTQERIAPNWCLRAWPSVRDVVKSDSSVGFQPSARAYTGGSHPRKWLAPDSFDVGGTPPSA